MVSLDTRDLIRVDRWLESLKPDASLQRDLGVELVSQTQERLVSEKTAPDGTPWKGWSDSYTAWRSKTSRNPGQGLGILTGMMLGAIDYERSGKYDVRWGSSMEYAGYFDAERQFVGLSSSNEADLVDIVESWLKRHARG